MNREEQIRKEIKECWFKDHKAELINYGDITVLNWRNPKSSSYYVRYVFDGYRMYISGDIGEAVFNLTWKATLESFQDLYLGYFYSKMATCSNGKTEYDSGEAVKELEKWKQELLEEKEFEDEDEKEEFINTIDEMISDANSCNSPEEWGWSYVNEKYSEFISENDHDYWEWIYKIGDVAPYHNYAYLIGLKMAYEQLSKDS